MKKAFTIIEVLVVIAIIAIVTGTVFMALHPERTPLYQSYQAWEKQTGNPNHLTFEEWRALIRVYNHEEQIPIPQ